MTLWLSCHLAAHKNLLIVLQRATVDNETPFYQQDREFTRMILICFWEFLVVFPQQYPRRKPDFWLEEQKKSAVKPRFISPFIAMV